MRKITSLELLVVVIILSLLTGFVIPFNEAKIYVYADTQPNIVIDTKGNTSNLVKGANVHNPQYSEVIEFLNNDDTDSFEYGILRCGWFANQVYNNAHAAGLNCAFVLIDYKDGKGHALNAFETTDRGLILIDCSFGEDSISRVTSKNIKQMYIFW